MCGISGIVSFNPKDHSYIEEMTTALSHRGPDGHSVWQDQTISLGHRRLSIIDIDNGTQPITNEKHNLYIIFNGEIYNFLELRKTLVQLGHTFSTKSDTEVIIHAIEQWGTEATNRFNGMWAFALWDTKEQSLFISRDRFGKKPIYYTQTEAGIFVFASEIKSILLHPAINNSLRKEAVAEYLCYGYIPSPRTWYEHIYELPSGHNLYLHQGHVQIRAWWDIKPIVCAVKHVLDLDDACAEVRRLLKEAVKIRMVSDVSIGAFLSGGIDSSIIVSEMQSLSNAPIKTFSIGFDQGGWYDESSYARTVATHLGTDHHEFRVKPDAYSLIDILVDHYDEPFSDSSALPTYLLSKLTREHVTVALAGDGGDEIFSGYERFRFAMINHLYQKIPIVFRKAFENFINTLPVGQGQAHSRIVQLQRVFGKLHYPVSAGFPRWLMLWEPNELRTLVDAEFYPDPEAYFLSYTHDIPDTLSSVMAYNLLTYLPQDLLVKVDRMSMAHGLEVRSPFLDIQLSEWALRLPSNLLWQNFTGKRILRDAYKHMLPASILSRRKHGFGVPLDQWFRKDLKVLITDILLSPDAYIYKYLNRHVIKQLCHQHWQYKRNAGHHIWSLLSLEVWLRKQFIYR